MLKKGIVALLSIVSVADIANAQATDNDLQLNTITTALPFMSITPDSRAGAMGDAGTALSASAYSIYWNTAMLNFAEKKSEIGISYTPWLRQLTNDIHLSYLSGYTKLGSKSAIAASLRYFSLGSITFTDASGNVLRDDKPSEYEIGLGYAFKLSENMSFGLNGKFANSNLTKGLTIPGASTKAAIAGAADISFVYIKKGAKLGSKTGDYTFGATINNIGNKVSYSETAERDFIPINLKIGNAYNMKLDAYNSITFDLDVQKLLVPTPALTNASQGYDDMPDGDMIGKSGEVGVIAGMLQSFYDAPGKPVRDEGGNLVKNDDGTYQIEKGSRLKEELREINLAFGMEYWYNKTFAIRTGMFYEHYTKGARQFLNAGVGLRYNMLEIDISYLLALKRNNPLANTLRFGLRFDIGSKAKDTTPTAPM